MPPATIHMVAGGYVFEARLAPHRHSERSEESKDGAQLQCLLPEHTRHSRESGNPEVRIVNLDALEYVIDTSNWKREREL